MAARRDLQLRGYTDAKMELDNTHMGDEAEASPAPEEPAPSRGTQDETTPTPVATPGGKKRRSWKRWVANLMIIAGVLLLAYPLGTWAYTWYEQRGLREQLETENPGMVASSSGLGSEDFISVDERAANAEQSSAAAASAAASAARGLPLKPRFWRRNGSAKPSWTPSRLRPTPLKSSRAARRASP